MATEITEAEEASRRQARRRVEGVYWAGVLIWAGLIFLLESTGSLPQVGQAGAWSWVFFGAGLYSLVLNVYYISSPDRPDPRAFDWIWGAILFLVGISGMIGWAISWPIVLLAIGVILLISIFFRRDE